MRLASIAKGLWNRGRYLLGGAALASAFLAPAADAVAEEGSPEPEKEAGRTVSKPKNLKPSATIESPIEGDDLGAGGSDFDPSSKDSSSIDDFDGSVESFLEPDKKAREGLAGFLDKGHFETGIKFVERSGNKPIRKRWIRSNADFAIDWRYFDFRYLYRSIIHQKIYDTTPDSAGEYDFSFLDPDYDPGELFSIFRSREISNTAFGNIKLGKAVSIGGIFEKSDFYQKLLFDQPEKYSKRGDSRAFGGFFKGGDRDILYGKLVAAYQTRFWRKSTETDTVDSEMDIQRAGVLLELMRAFRAEAADITLSLIWSRIFYDDYRMDQMNPTCYGTDIDERIDTLGIDARLLGESFGLSLIFLNQYIENDTDFFPISTPKEYKYEAPLYACASFQLTDGFAVAAHARYTENRYPGGGFGFFLGDILDKRSFLPLLEYHRDLGREIVGLDICSTDTLQEYEKDHRFDRLISRIYHYRTKRKKSGLGMLWNSEAHKASGPSKNRYDYSIDLAVLVTGPLQDGKEAAMVAFKGRFFEEHMKYQRFVFEFQFDISSFFLSAGIDWRTDREYEEFKNGPGWGLNLKLGWTF